MRRLKEAIDRGDVRTGVDQKFVAVGLFDRAVQQNNGTDAMDPRHIAKRMSAVFKTRAPGTCISRCSAV